MRTSFKARLAACWRSGLVGALLSVVVGMVLLSEPDPDSFSLTPRIIRWLGAVSYDVPLRLGGKVKTPELVIVAMDQESYQKLDQPPAGIWDRGLHADLLDRVVAMGARAVVFDVWFGGSSTNPVADRRLAEAIMRATNRVVLAAFLTQSFEGQSPGSTNSAGSVISQAQIPSLPFASPTPWGVADLPLDPDHRVRRHYTNANYSTLAWKVAELLGRAPPDPLRARWINFYGADGLPHKSYHDVLQTNALPPDFFTNKVVFVGRYKVLTPLGTAQEDQHQTPYAGTFPGVELQATAFLNLLRKDWLNELPRGVEYAVFIVCGLFFGFGLVLLRPWVAVPAGVLGAGVTLVAGLWLFWGPHYWFPWLTIVAVQIPCALVWSVVAHTQWLTREKADLERKLATSLLAGMPGRSVGANAGGGSWSDPPGRMPSVPDHTLLRRVGQGAYGDVWLARDLIGNYRAVKAVYRDRFPRIEPFEREFRGIQKYSPISRKHPGWLDILHVGRNEADGCFFYIMEVGDDQTTGQTIDPERYVPRTLAGDLTKRGKLPVDECIRVSIALADAMAHLHQHGLIHRDVKPSNVIFVQGAPKFADIGLVTDASAAGREVSLLGTEGYIAPEGPGSPVADLFSLGKLIYELCTGHDRRVFPEMPTSLIESASDPAMEQLYRIVLKACEIEPRYRYQTAGELSAELQKVQDMISPPRKG